jgi:sugar lactone lactonase YvrE
MSIRASIRVETVQPQLAGQCNGATVFAYGVANRVGECPTWHTSEHCLYWIDVRGQQLLRLHPEAAELTRWDLPDVVGSLALWPSGQLWLAMRHGLFAMDLASGALEAICMVEPDRPGNRLNDGKVSPSGRWFIFASMDDRPIKKTSGRLYCCGADGVARPLHDDLVVGNGIAWSPDATRIYFSDSTRGLLMYAPWDEPRGEMGPAGLLATFDEAQGRPDGAAVDAAGNYWSAGVSAGCLNVLDNQGALLRKWPLPCRAPTMPAFGGRHGETLFITSLVRPTWQEPDQWDGALLSVNLAHRDWTSGPARM